MHEQKFRGNSLMLKNLYFKETEMNANENFN